MHFFRPNPLKHVARRNHSLRIPSRRTDDVKRPRSESTAKTSKGRTTASSYDTKHQIQQQGEKTKTSTDEARRVKNNKSLPGTLFLTIGVGVFERSFNHDCTEMRFPDRSKVTRVAG